MESKMTADDFDYYNKCFIPSHLNEPLTTIPGSGTVFLDKTSSYKYAS